MSSPIRVLLAITLVLAACTEKAPTALPHANRRADAVFVNGNFEDGGIAGWSVATSLNRGIINPPTSRASLQLLDGGVAKTRVVTGPTETIIPSGLTAAVSLRVPKYGTNAAVVNEAGASNNVNALSQQFTVTAADVDPTDAKIHVRFALAPVLNSGGHPAEQQPYFWVTLTNVTKGATMFGTFNFADQAGVPWQIEGVNRYTDWQSFDIAPGNVALSIGDVIKLEVIAAGCSQGGHWGEVYVDGFGPFLPGLSVTATAPQSANAGSNLTYTLSYQNRGAGTATNTLVTFNLPTGVTYQSLSAAGATCTSPVVGAATGAVVCNVGSVNPSASGALTVTVNINASATGKISAGNYSVRSDGFTPLLGPLVETAISAGVVYADLASSVSDGIAAIGWGQPYSATFTVSNLSGSTATAASVVWVAPAQLTGVSWTCTASAGSSCGAASGTGSMAHAVTLPASGFVTYAVAATVVAGSGNGAMSNLVTVTAPSGVQDSDSTNNQAIDINSIGTLRTVTLAKAGSGTGRVVTSPAAIDCGSSCGGASTAFLDGTGVGITATAAAGQTFSGWSGPCTGTANPCVFTVSADTTLTATFDVLPSNIVASAGAGGAVSPSGTVSVAYGANQTFTITPSVGKMITGVLVDGVSVGAVASYTFSNVVAPHSIAATFAVQTFGITASAGPNGSVTPSGTQTVASGSAASVAITPAAHYDIADVLVDGVSVGPVSQYTFSSVTAPHTLDATFAIQLVTFSASAGPNGSVSPPGVQSVAYGSAMTIAITPAANCDIVDVLVDGVSVGPVSQYTFSSVTSPHSVAATFALQTFTVTASTGPNGSVSPSGAQRIAYGSDALLVITPDPAWEVSDVLVDGVSVGAVTQYNFSNVTAAHTLAAAFVLSDVAPTLAVSPGSAAWMEEDAPLALDPALSLTDPDGPNLDAAMVAFTTGYHPGQDQLTFTAQNGISGAFDDSTGVLTLSGPASAAHYEAALRSVAYQNGLTGTPDIGVRIVTFSLIATTTPPLLLSDFRRLEVRALQLFVVSAIAGSDGAVTPSGNQSIKQGHDAAFAILPAAHFHVADVRVDGASVGAVTQYTFTAVSAVHTLSATFAIDTFAVTAAGDANGTVTCASPVAWGAQTTCTVTPADGYALQSLLDNGNPIAASVTGNTFAVTVTADHTFAATFTKTLGGGCTDASECNSGICVDGVCCNTMCQGQCEACAQPGSAGTCTAVAGAPASGRPACLSDSTVCGGTCDGVVTSSCSYPSAAIHCRAASCASGVETLAATCDGAGACPAPVLAACQPFVCGDTACASSCTADAQCGAGFFCEGSACVPHLVAGDSCGRDGACGTGNCVDGVCCNSACNGQCEACDVNGHVGECSPSIGAPHASRTACDTDGSTCGGTCDGVSRASCVYPGAATACRTASCSSGTATLASSCDGAGACPAEQTQGCGAFVCGASACLGDCTADTDCTSGNWCSGGVCVPHAVAGGSCGADNQCGSGFCTDGVCCNGTCDGQCEACNLPTLAGTCSPVTGAPHAGRPDCASDESLCGGSCDGTLRTACAYPQANTQCRAPACGNGIGTLAAACDGHGSCPNEQTVACGGFTCGASACLGGCQADSDCATNNWCAAGVCVPHLAQAAQCGANNQCSSGNCVDGVCCNTACDGQCAACDVPGAVGICAAVHGSPHGTRTTCDSDGSLCGGQCDGTTPTACSYPAVECRAASCAAGTATLAATCSQGRCPAVQTQSCGTLACGLTACKGTCAASSDCAGGNFCSAGVCVPLKAAAHSCASDGQCGSGHCVDGVCCNTACNGQCEACDVAGSAGSCVAAQGAPHGSRAACAGGASTCGGVCDGQQRARCTYPDAASECVTASCTSGVETHASACDGAGRCAEPTTALCGNARCGATACNAACTTDAECSAGAFCVAGVCQANGDHSQWRVQGGGGSGCSSTGASAAGWMVALVLVALARVRRRSLVAIAALGVALLGPAVSAQTQSSGVSRTFLLERFAPQAGAADLLGVQSAQVAPHLSPNLVAVVSYANMPLRAVAVGDDGMSRSLAVDQTTLTAMASVGVFDRFEVSLAVPVVFTQSVGAAVLDPSLAQQVPDVALADVRISVKARLASAGAFGFAVSLPVTLPTGARDGYVGYVGVTANPMGIVEWRGGRGAAISLNAGLALRPPQQLLNLTVGNAFTYGLGGQVDLVPSQHLALLLNVGGELGLAGLTVPQCPLEALAAVRWMPIPGLALTLGAGPGLTPGYGTPRFRVVASVGWAPRESAPPAAPAAE